ncbi:alpha/beta fold hydrolase [Synechococcus sp. NB0720_010]|uniref:alpha/beta fold hydrolase n=1 Tax=Synechococcus sp. NB0720_010 TaxID=2907159 RepID=UPI001FFBBFC7|nr:alpha/beta hydrolase [Synechococcus sp. NB0720_010]UPH90875.1 alpha/beta hydrolase [Synechococcus sp. NB0720_010]
MPEHLDQRQLLERAAKTLLDPKGQAIARAVQWWDLPSACDQTHEPWPVAVLGSGAPVLLLHGFDSSHLEFRRLSPLLSAHAQLFIPDLYGFGFCPRPQGGDYSPAGVLRHLEAVLDAVLERSGAQRVGLIGASMGGSAAVELARRRPHQIDRLLLLAPAGLTGKPMPVPPLLNQLGARFLALPAIRRGLCRSAFAQPDRDVGPAELEIASIHLRCPNWAPALAAFAGSGGFGGCGLPLPHQRLQVLWGANDRILQGKAKADTAVLLGERITELGDCGHLPHIDQPDTVVRTWHG